MLRRAAPKGKVCVDNVKARPASMSHIQIANYYLLLCDATPCGDVRCAPATREAPMAPEATSGIESDHADTYSVDTCETPRGLKQTNETVNNKAAFQFVTNKCLAARNGESYVARNTGRQ